MCVLVSAHAVLRWLVVFLMRLKKLIINLLHELGNLSNWERVEDS